MVESETQPEPERDGGQDDNARVGELEAANDRFKFLRSDGCATLLASDESMTYAHRLIDAEDDE